MQCGCVEGAVYRLLASVFRRRFRLPNTASSTYLAMPSLETLYITTFPVYFHYNSFTMANLHVLAAFDPSTLPSRTAHEFQPYKPQLAERNLEHLFEFI